MMDPQQVPMYLEAWQRCLPENLSNLFSYYSVNFAKTERVASFFLDESDLKKLVNLKELTTIRILMGCEPDPHFGKVPMSPDFAPILQAMTGDPQQGYENCFQLHHLDLESNSVTFERGIPLEIQTLLGDPGQITPNTGLLFIWAWLECPFNGLGEQFEGIGMTANLRVQFYEYNEQETKDIITAIKKHSIVSRLALMTVNMGLSLPVQVHPFGFRPVIVVQPSKSLAKTSDDGDVIEYFEFSNPCPPLCPNP